MDLGSLFSALGRALPGFVEGERQAIADNWKDLDNYNNVQAGQLQNAWTEATWEPRKNNVWMQSWNNALNTVQNAGNARLYLAMYPYKLRQAQGLSANADPLVDSQIAAMYGAQGGGIDPQGNGSLPVNPFPGMGYPQQGQQQQQQQQQQQPQQPQEKPSGINGMQR